MSVRLNRLRSDHEGMKALARESALIDFEARGTPPDAYVVTYRAKGMSVDGQDAPVPSELHRIEILLHADYPAQPPALKQLTPIFHPNFAPWPANQICIDAAKWTPAESLPELVLRFFDMITYRLYNSANPYNAKAVTWAGDNARRLPLEPRGWARSPDGAEPAVRIVSSPPAGPGADVGGDCEVRIVR